MNNFINKFEKYDFPKMGYIKIPKIIASEKEIRELKLSENYDGVELIKKLTKQKLPEWLKTNKVPPAEHSIYIDRLKHEISEVVKLKFCDYLLLVYKVIEFCKENDILNSPARGSCGGSLLLAVLGCIKINPIKHNLLFERFISSARTEIKVIDGEEYIKSESLPDFDLDSQQSLKYRINEFLEQYFPNRTAAICNVSTLQSKVAIKEVYKCIEEASEEEAKRITDMFEVVFGKVESIDDAIKHNDELRKWSEEHEKVVNVTKSLLFLKKHTSIHASGIALCNDELTECIPLQLDSNKNIVCGYTMNDAQEFSIKFDNLGIKNLNTVQDCLKMIGKKIEDIDVNDKSIYDYLNNSDCYYNVFQAEEGLGKSVMQKLKCRSVDDGILSISVGRPGSMSFLDDIIKAKEYGEVKDWGDKRINDCLASSYGVIVYQEAIMALCKVMANFTPIETNEIRKIVGKKMVDKMPLWKDKFINQSIENGFKKEVCEEVWKTFVNSGNYLFNKCLWPYTIVETKDKFKTMQEVMVGEEIKSYDIDNKQDIFVKVKSIFSNKAELYEVELDDGRKIKASLNHKFLCSDNKMRSLEIILEQKHKILTD